MKILLNKKTIGILTFLFVFFYCMSFSVYAKEDSSNNEKYISFELSDLTTDASKNYIANHVETSGGKIIKEDGKFYLIIDYVTEEYTKTIDGKVTYSKIRTDGYFKAILDETEYDLFEKKDETKDLLIDQQGSSESYYKIAEGKIPLNISSFDEARGKKIFVKYNRSSNPNKYNETATITLGKVSDLREYPLDLSIDESTAHIVWDGRYGANYNQMDSGRKVSVKTSCDAYTVSTGGMEWYYTTGEEEITRESTKLVTGIQSGSISQTIQADDEKKPEAYDMKVRVRGYIVSTGEWTEEASVTIPWSKASVFSILKDEKGLLGVSAGYNALPYDAKLTAENITDESLLEKYGEQLKEVAGENYGDFYALDVKLTDSDGNKVKLQSPTGDDWGEGYYGTSGAYEQNVEVQRKYDRRLFVYLDKEKGYWPKNTKVYYVGEDGVKELPTPVDSLLPDSYEYTLTSWDTKGQLPDGVYLIMQEPMPALSEDTKTGDYRVPVKFVMNETDDDGNEIDQWFSTISEWNDYIGNDGLAHIQVDADGNKTLYLTLQENDGKYLRGIRYGKKTGEKIEIYTVEDGEKEVTYPKLVKLPLSDSDKNASYITMQVQTEGGWQDVTLAVQYSAMYEYGSLSMSSPSITTETGAANFVNDAEAKVLIHADAVNGKIYYTTDGTEPTQENGILYEEPFTLKTEKKDGESFTIKAIATKDGYAPSKASSFTLTFKKEGESAETVEAPLIKARYDYAKEGNGDTAENGWYLAEFSTDTEGADIYYTLDGTTPTKDSIKYDGNPVSIPAMTDAKATVIHAIALKDGYNDSSIETKTIEFSTSWWDNLQEGDSYEVIDELVNLGVYVNQGIRTQSMGASALTGKATLYVKNGKKYLEVPLQPINVSGIPGRLIDMWYFDGNDNNDGKTYAFHFSSENQDGAIKGTYTYNDDGSVKTVILPLFSDCERVYIGLETDVDIMGKQGSIIWLDYSDVIEKVTGQVQEKEEQAQMPVISYEKDEENDSYTITITAEEGAKIQYSVNSAEGSFEWREYVEPFTVTGKDAEVEKGTTNISAMASIEGKKDSNIAAEKLTFKDFGKEDRELEDGTYLADVAFRKADNPEIDSMANNAISKPILITVKDGKYYVTANFQGITITIGDQKRFGYMQSLSYLDADGNYVDTTVNGYYDTVVDIYNEAEDGTASFYYPRQLTFPLVNGKAGDDEDGYVHLKVMVPVMESLGTGQGTKTVYMDIDWSSTEEVTISDASALGESLVRVKEKLAEEKKYTKESFSVLKKAYEDASSVYYALGSSETQIASVKEMLDTAVEGLQETTVIVIDKTKLETVLQKAKEELEKEEKYTTTSIQALKDAIEEAEIINQSETASQAEVDEQVTKLNAVIEVMELQPDKTELLKKYNEALKIYESGNEEGKYVEKAWKEFETAVLNAKNVLEDGDAKESEVVAARTELFNTMNNLTVSVDKSALEALLNEAEKKDTNDCTDTSVAAFDAAKVSAKKVLEDDDASQDNIDKQYKLLSKAMAALVLKVDDETTVYDGTYTIFGRLWQSTADIPENWKDDSATGNSMGDAALNHEIKMTVKNGKATLTLEFLKNEYMLFDMPTTGYLKNLAYFPGYTGETAPTKLTATKAEIVSYWEDADGNRVSDSYGTDYPRYMNLPLDNLGQQIMWVQVYVPVMESIQTGNGTQYAKLVLDWDSRKQLTGIETNKNTLRSLITKAKGLEQGTASDETYAAVLAAVEFAEDVNADLNVSQEVVDAVTNLLQAAINAMDSAQVEVDKAELKSQLEKAKAIVESDDIIYTEATLDVLKTAYENGLNIYDRKDASQSEVNSAVMNLKNAIGDLIKVADKTKLKAAMENAAKILEDTDSYTASAIDALEQIYAQAEEAYEDSNTSQATIDSLVSALNYMVKNMVKIENTVDKDALAKMLIVAANMAGRESIYTAESLDNLKAVIEAARAAYDDKSATEEEVDEQVSLLTTAIVKLERDTSSDNGGNGNNNNGNNNNGNNNNNNNGGNNNNTLDINNLPDGVYSLTGNMVKVDKETASMSDAAINHTVKLTVKDGKYYITLNFDGLTVGQRLGYLSQLKYFTTGYTLDKYGNPQGTLADVTIDSYQKNSDGSLVSDTYGTDYPDEVTFELIPEALKDGYVPLQVYVPIMESISAGTGTQPVFLKLDWSTLKETTSDDPDFSNSANNNNNNNNGGTTNTNGGTTGTLGTNTLGSSSLTSGTGSSLSSGSGTSGTSSLKSGTGSSLSSGSTASSLKSGTGSSLSSGSTTSGTSSLKSGTTGTGSSLQSASSVKTGDEIQNNALWAAILLLGGVLLMAGVMEYKKTIRKVKK